MLLLFFDTVVVIDALDKGIFETLFLHDLQVLFGGKKVRESPCGIAVVAILTKVFFHLA